MKRKKHSRKPRAPRALERADLAVATGGDETHTVGGSGFFKIRDEGG